MTAVPFLKSPYYQLLLPELAGLSGAAEEIRRHTAEYAAWMESLPEDRLDRAYAPGKWTPRVLLGHVVDSHIIVAFRILSFGRGEVRELPGADENLWATVAGHERIPLAELLRGYRAAAATTDWIAGTLPPDAMDRTGVANGILLTVRELHSYIIAHERHHRRVLAEKYRL
ncbi:MAG: DinB family protein [Fibrobacteres bacterium]|nr:DinB family protein [Fibrobacterota bacterium]